MIYDDLIERQRAQYQTSLPSALQRLDWSAGQLATEQQPRLRALLGWARQRSLFYRERLAGIDPATVTEADLPSITGHDQRRDDGQLRRGSN